MNHQKRIINKIHGVGRYITNSKKKNCLSQIHIKSCFLLQSKLGNRTISTAESLTGGLVAVHLTSIPGSSTYFKSSLVTYAVASKVELLGVNLESVEKYGVVSEEVAREMAEGCRRVTKSDFTLGLTGYAGPDGDDVGLVWFAVSNAEKTKSWQCRFEGTRNEIREKAAFEVLTKLKDFID